jgi:CBS domain-containing protein
VNNAAAAINPETTLREAMATEIVPLKPEDTLGVVNDLLNRFRTRHFPVFDNDQLCGVICQADLLCASLASISRNPREALSKVAVKSVMKPATTALPETSIYDAARLMVEDAIECLIVVEGKKVLGLVSRTDLLRALARK